MRSQLINRFKNNFGFSLMEMITAVGISSILSVGMGYLIVQSIAENQKAKSNLEIERFGREIKQSILQVGKKCTASVQFLSPIPAGAATATVPIRIQLPTGEIIAAGSSSAARGYEIVEADFARAELKGTDIGGNSLYQGFIEVRARYGTSGSDLAKVPLRKVVVGSMMARVSGSGAFVDCFSTDINAESSVCERLGLEFDVARGSCRWDTDMNDATGSTCGSSQPMIGIVNGGKRCDRPYTDYCTGSQIMVGFSRGRAICSDPPAEITMPPPPGPPLPPGPVPTPPAPPAPPPVVNPAAPPAPAPVPAPGPMPPGVVDVTAPPDCSKIAVADNCQEFCFDFFFGYTCETLCLPATGADEPCAVVESNTTPPPLAPPAPPNPPPTAPPAGSCSCGGVTISAGQHCGACYREYEAEDYYGGRRLPIVIREESFICSGGNLVYDPVPNPNRGACSGGYEVW